MLDVSSDGTCLQHHAPMKIGSRIDIDIEDAGESFRIAGLVTRCSLSGYTTGTNPEPIYNSGVRFDPMDEATQTGLQALIHHFEGLAVEEARTIGEGELPEQIGKMPLQVWLRNKLK